MRVSEYYKLGRTQSTLDFVDIDVLEDTKLFVDPRALRLLPSRWADECVSLIQNFFSTVLAKIKSGAEEEAERLLAALREPNETHLGLSVGRSRGRAVGEGAAHNVGAALSKSEAAHSGLLEDLEDTVLMVPGISSDIVSDITTNIIRQPLIKYTYQMAEQYGIPLQQNVASGPLWEPAEKRWFQDWARLPVTEHGKLLLVPKAIVRRRMEYDSDEYFYHYILEHLRQVELHSNSELVQLLKNGMPRVTKKDLIEKYGRGKSVSLRETIHQPEILNRYRQDKESDAQPPMDHEELALCEEGEYPDWQSLLESVLSVESGRRGASAYEDAIEGLLSALFYPSLVYPQKQRAILAGRKRVDITYTNCASRGFFHWLGQHHTAPHVFVECKNYASDPANPELDQLSGRFSPSRGKFGLLVCRGINDKKLFMERCRDTANDQRGFIVGLDDDDLIQVVRARREDPEGVFEILRRRFEALVL